MTTSQNSSALPLNRREFWFYVFFASLLALITTFIAGFSWYLTPQENWIYYGHLDDIGYEQPNLIQGIYFLRTDDPKLPIVAWRPFSPLNSCSTVQWVDANSRFEDYCLGGIANAWTLHGERIHSTRLQSNALCTSYDIFVDKDQNIYLRSARFGERYGIQHSPIAKFQSDRDRNWKTDPPINHWECWYPVD